MYKVVVVEDDRIIRKAISQSNWKSINACVIGEASNGEDALVIIEETQPHLVITDINMPFMNGITLAKNVREKFKETRIIFLTGYDDFEYLHEAILLKSDDYLLKPIKMNALLDKARNALDIWVKENQRNDQISKTLPMLQEQFISKLLFNKKDISEKKILNELDYLGIQFKNGPFFILNLLATDYSNESLFYEKLIVLKEWDNLELMHYQFNEVFLICFFNNEKDEKMIRIKSQVLKDNLKALGLNKGISNLIVTESNLHTQVSDFKIALLEAKVNMEQKITDYNDEDIGLAIKFSLEKQLEEIKRIEAFLNLLELNTFKLTEVKKIGFNITTYINKVLSKTEDKKGSDVYEIGKKIMRADDHHELYAIIYPLLKEWKKKYERQMNDSLSDSLIKRAKAYINKNYENSELTLTSLADELHITAPYLSNLFKSELKMNFTGYLLELRMEKAKKLLTKTDLKIYQIANSVGYSNAHYFSSSFKKYTGQMPTEYKKKTSSK